MPSIKLTEAAVKAARPADHDIILWDTDVIGFGCKVTPAGRKAFFAYYRTQDGQQRRPSIGVHGALKCEQARAIAQRMLAEVAAGRDPSTKRQQDRKAPTVRDLCGRFLRDYAEARSKPSYLRQQRRMIETKIVRAMGAMKVAAVSRSDVVALHNSLKDTPYEANRVLALLSVIFRFAELSGLRAEGSNPCRLVDRYPERRRERLLTDAEVRSIFTALANAEEVRAEMPSVILAVRLLFATAGRASEILGMRWDYLRDESDEIVWPDNKAGGELRKPLTKELRQLLEGAERVVGNPLVCVNGDRTGPLSMGTLEKAWRRILKAADVPHCGLHAIRHRAATEIANDARIPIHVAMKLTGHKTVATLLRYHHAQRDQVREAAEQVNERRRAIVGHKGGDVVPLPRNRA